MAVKVNKILGKTRANEQIKDLLYSFCDHKTALFLSGGSTPKSLYEALAKEKKLRVGSVAMIDERYGARLHPKSNELMIKETGLLDFLEKGNVKFNPILEGKDLETTTNDYDETVRFLFNNFPKSIGILGIGEDGHSAGIAPNRNNFINPIFGNKVSFVSSFNDAFGNFGERVTLTFEGLSNLDKIIILAFGEEKKDALFKMLTPGSLEEIPARFFNQKEISEKVVLFTDQPVVV